jgi:hypothetical protein
MEEYRVQATRARKSRCAELGVNCGELQNGSARGLANYRIWKEIGAGEGIWRDCECQMTTVENVDVPRGTQRRKPLMNWHLFHVEQRFYAVRTLRRARFQLCRKKLMLESGFSR